jgi:hypothetical protein
MTTESQFEIDTDPASVQLIVPRPSERFEGVGFSSSGDILGVATSEHNTVLLFRRKAGGQFEDQPYCTIGGAESGLAYPHDVSFSACGQLLAIAQRRGSIVIYERDPVGEGYGPQPVFEIDGPSSKLAFSDGVAFVPPDDEYLAACNLELGTISFYRRISRAPVRFEVVPEFELKHRSIYHPDGLAFSCDGKWLATANHGGQSVCIFSRQSKLRSGGKLRYGPRPVSVIADPQFRYPHSVAFSPRTNHLVVTNAGANYFCAYEPTVGYFNTRWSDPPAFMKIVNDEDAFVEVNCRDKMEGGPKGIAVHDNMLAVSCPEFGIKIYACRERFPGCAAR